MKNIAFILLLTATLFSCAKKKAEKTTVTEVKKEAPTVIKETKPEVVTQPKSVPVLKIPDGIDANLVAKIQRTPCYGKCPVFTIELYKDGLVKYNGMAYVERKGNFTAKVNTEFIKNIQDKALSIKYLSFENKYPIAPVTIADLPTTTTYMRIGDEGKLITDNFDAPKNLIEFENWLAHAFDKLEWVEEK